MAEAGAKSSLRCLLFSDLVGSTALKTRLGDEAAGDLIARHHALVRRLIGEAAGREIDCAGDGFFVTFDAPSAAVSFALRLQQAHHTERDLPAVRIGVHMGEVTERPAPPGTPKPTLVEGLAVDLASRVASLAVAGQILMSAPVFDAARQRLRAEGLNEEVIWCAHGPYRFKGIDLPVEIGEAGFARTSPLVAPPDSEKAQRAVTAGDEITLGWRPAVGLGIPGRPHWRLEAQLGSGAIGEVWLAAHEKSHAHRVFKFCLQADRVRGLRRELVLLRLLKERLGQRDDIAQVIDWELDSPPYFLETEYSEAGDLVDWARRRGGIGTLPLETRVELVAQIAEALGAAHAAGVLHRDLKPRNILMSEDASGRPRARLTDFGIGVVTSREALSTPGVTVAGLTETLLSSESTSGAGTRLYMAPELIEGKAATPLSDVYSLGVILYQVAAGDFARALSAGWEEDVDDELLRADIAACIDGHPERRLSSPLELAARLRALATRRAALRAGRRRRRLVVGAAAVAVLAGVAVLGAWVIRQNTRVRWARETALPEIQRLIEREKYAAAFALAREVERSIPSDPLLAKQWERMSNTISIHTEPPGARISFKEYENADGEWAPLGVSPVEEVRFPRGVFRWQLEKEGYEPREVAFRVPDPALNKLDLDSQFRNLHFTLDREGSLPEGMVPVEAGPPVLRYGSLTFRGATSDRFLLDRTEVTNREFKEFLDAGGYQRPELWKEAFVKDGRTVSWEEAVALFRDSTGRPGPATWLLGDHRAGEGSHPVGGVSWYEVAAYCEFRGKRLPTMVHWFQAALSTVQAGYQGWSQGVEATLNSLSPSIVASSNFSGEGPAPVGTYPAISAAGASDMAGNVREWVWNAGSGGRYLLGGAWSDPPRFFVGSVPSAYVESPWHRFAIYGFRCAMYPGGEPADALKAAYDLPPPPDYRAVPPLSDETFKALHDVYAYEHKPLNAEVVSSAELAGGGREERILIDAGYGGERLPIRLRTPGHIAPPYQAVIWFPGSEAFLVRRIEDSANTSYLEQLSFFVKSGRVLVEPAFAGLYERSDETLGIMRWLSEPSYHRELVTKWLRDIGRTIDYLEARGDIAAGRVAWVGLSLGSMDHVPLFFAHEERIRVAILWSGGFEPVFPAVPEEVDGVRRAIIPILMLNGRYDTLSPLETGQEPMFDLLGTPEKDKRHVVFEATHWPLPRSEIVKESLAWLDRYLGPVH